EPTPSGRRREEVTAGVLAGRAPGEAETDFDAFYRAQWAATVRLAHVLTGLDNPAAYLRKTVVNACRSWHRSRTRETARIARAHAGSDGLVIDLRDDLLERVDQLPYKQKAVVVLRYYEDLSEADIAAALDIRPGTVKSLAARGLARLRQEIEQ
ncbi:MAG: sigma-70 family RNA polymerase sigma factor, partial [Actinomycetota bacterium]|nr:sigma-70 family RNA polymerase sigma factor [Actinomycetota bacterium]